MTATAAVAVTQQASAELERRAAAVVAAVHAVDGTAAPGIVQAVLVEVARTPHKRARIVRHLHEHADALTAGSSATPKLVGALIAALLEAGVTGLVVPTCADCGLPHELFHTLGPERICRRCYEKRQSTTQTCGSCGKRCRAHGRTSDGTPLCQVCQHNSRAVACSRCGRVCPVTYSRRDGKPYCRGCRARNRLEPCTGCGNLRTVNIRDPHGRGYCGSCYARAKPLEVCAECGTTAPVAERRGDGGAVCASCHALPKRVCGTCGRTRRVALRATATRPDICPTCYQAPEITCSVCGDTALGRRTTADGRPMCFRCQACQRVDAALTGPDGTIPETLRPIRDAIVHADNPRSVLNNFTHDNAMMLLTAIARGERPLSHDALDKHAGCYSVEHLRSLLVAAAALPARDEYLQRLQRFTTALLDTVDNPADRRLLAAFCRWHLLAPLRRRTTGALTPHAAYRCRGDLTAAHRFLVFVRDRDHDPASCTQDDINTWFAQPTQHTVDASRGFLGWALRRRHLGAVTIPPRTRHQPTHFRAEDQRWDLARRMLHDPNAATVPDRVAACLVLLYAQPPARIVTLTRGHAPSAEDGTVQLRLGATAITVPPPLDELLTQLPTTRPAAPRPASITATGCSPAAAPDNTCTPPGWLNGCALSASSRAPTAIPPCCNWPPISRPPSWPTSSASTSAPPSTGPTKRAVTGPTTPPSEPRPTSPALSHPAGGVEKLAPVELLIAANPDPESRLPYLLRLPIAGGMVFRTSDTWPRTKALYCHPMPIQEWPDEPEIVERVPLRSCKRRGAAIDLVLDRSRENRSQIVFTTARDRDVVFWQSPRTRKQARPNVRIPTARAAGITELEIVVDSHEQYPYRFTDQQVRTVKRALPCGDYAITVNSQLIAAVERKSLPDLVTSLTTGKLRYALGELSALPRAAVVIEDRYSALFKLTHARPATVADGLAELQIRWPGVPIIFCETRPLAEEWTYRFLAAAHEWACTEHAAAQLLSTLTPVSAELDDAPDAPQPSTAEVRAWARSTGLTVPDRGRLRPEIWNAWRAAHETNNR